MNANNQAYHSKQSYCNTLESSGGKITGGPQKHLSELLEYDTPESSKENESVYSDSCPSLSRIVKRKVLRHKNGKAVISEEESTFTPSSDSIYTCDTSAKEVSSLEKSWLSFSDSSSNAESETRPPFVSSSSRKGRYRKSDPVSLYHEYRKYWEAFKPPGETNHPKLRWAIREKMLVYDDIR